MQFACICNFKFRELYKPDHLVPKFTPMQNDTNIVMKSICTSAVEFIHSSTYRDQVEDLVLYIESCGLMCTSDIPQTFKVSIIPFW